MIIQSIQYANTSDIVSYYPFPKGSVQIDVSAWTEIPMHPASGDLNVSSTAGDSGYSFRHNISCRLKNSFTIPDAAILRLEMCDGSIIIIGSPDIPVRFTKSITLYLETLSIIYDSFTEPLKLTEPS